MPRHPTTGPTDVELQILDVLWRLGSATVRQVHDALAEQRETGYSTTLKMIQVMREKGLVVRDDSVRPQLYQAAESREKTQLDLLDEMAQKAFGGSAARLVMRMLSADRVSAEEFAEMQQMIDRAKGEKR